QPLATKNLVNARNATGKPIRGIKESRVGISHRDGPGEQIRRDFFSRTVTFAFVQQLDRTLRPASPMPQQSACDTEPRFAAARPDTIFSEQIDHDIIVVSGIESDLVRATRFSDGSDHIERLVAIEGGDFDGNDVWDFGETTPKTARQEAPAGRWLQVKTEERNLASDSLAVLDEFTIRCVPKRRERHEAGVKSIFPGEFSFCDGLFCGTTNAGDAQRLTAGAIVAFSNSFRSQLKHGLK